jgi:hypothetical protein
VTKNLEAIDIAVPGGNPQGDANDCGPNSAWRVLKAYGGTATLQRVLSTTYRSSVLSAWNLGTTGQTLVGSMNANRRGISNKFFSLATGQDINDVIEQLKAGRPVVAMIGRQDSGRAAEGLPGQIIDTIFGESRNRVPTEAPNLHWIAVTGFDGAEDLIYFTDTDGQAYQLSMTAFDHLLRWSFDDVSQRTLQGLGVTPGTIIY